MLVRCGEREGERKRGRELLEIRRSTHDCKGFPTTTPTRAATVNDFKDTMVVIGCRLSLVC